MPRVRTIEVLATVLTVLATIASSIIWDAQTAMGVGLGGALGVLNFFTLRRIVGSMISTESQGKQAALGGILTAKFAVLGFVIFFILRFLPVSGVALISGFSLLVLSILLAGFASVIKGAEPQAE